MKKYVALLRGINVGGNSKVSMAELKFLFEKIGFKNVKTYINSGNVIFTSDQNDLLKMVSLIEVAILKNLKLPIRVVIRDSNNIKKLCQVLSAEFQNNTELKTDVLFLGDEYHSKKSLELIKFTSVDHLKYVSGAIIWLVARADYKKSGMNKFVGTELYKNMTARNVNTVRKLALLLD